MRRSPHSALSSITISTTIAFSAPASAACQKRILPFAKKARKKAQKKKKKIRSIPSGRWKQRLAHADVAAIEATVGDSLLESGYELSLPAGERRLTSRLSSMRAIYPAFLDAKLWLKLHTPLGRFARLSALKLDENEKSFPAAESVRS